ncbi:hypothetical protein ED210_22570, partial [Escherichia coli]|nr:hypothetical protein [Escherichia coli]
NHWTGVTINESLINIHYNEKTTVVKFGCDMYPNSVTVINVNLDKPNGLKENIVIALHFICISYM